MWLSDNVPDVNKCLLADAFADAAEQDGETSHSKDYVHIRIQQRNGKKSLTTIQVSHRATGTQLSAGVCCAAPPQVPRAVELQQLPCRDRGALLVYLWTMLINHCAGQQHAMCCLSSQGLEKGFDYKKVLKAFKKGGPTYWMAMLSACRRLSYATVTLLYGFHTFRAVLIRSITCSIV